MAVSILRVGCISIIFYALSTVSNGVLQGNWKSKHSSAECSHCPFPACGGACSTVYFTDLDLYALVLATMFYAPYVLLNNLSVRKYLGYRQEMKKTFIIPVICSAIMGILCYIFYQGIYLILSGSTGKFYSFKDIGIYLSYDFCGICSYRIFCSGIKVKGNYRSRASKVSKRTSACQNGKEK